MQRMFPIQTGRLTLLAALSGFAITSQADALPAPVHNLYPKLKN